MKYATSLMRNSVGPAPGMRSTGCSPSLRMAPMISLSAWGEERPSTRPGWLPRNWASNMWQHPTIAATDAPTASACVVYSNEGSVVDYFTTSNPDYVLVDTRIIAEAPARFLVSGMGDALATWKGHTDIITVKRWPSVPWPGWSSRKGRSL